MGKSLNWVAAALMLVVAYFVIVLWAIGPDKILTFFTDAPALNNVGDFLAGVFAFPAFILLGAAVFMQRQELSDARAQFDNSAKLIKAQLDQVEEQNRITYSAAKANYRLAVHEKRMLAYNRLIEARTAYIEQGAESEQVLKSIRLASIQAEFLFDSNVDEFIMTAMRYAAFVLMLHMKIEKGLDNKDKGYWDSASEIELKGWQTDLEDNKQSLYNMLIEGDIKGRFRPYLLVPLSLDETE